MKNGPTKLPTKVKFTKVCIVAFILTTVVIARLLFPDSLSIAASPSAPSLETMLASLRVNAEKGAEFYTREAFPHWIDADGDRCDTRGEVLQQESKIKTSCTALKGSWVSAYDGLKTSNASTFDVDHFIPLKEAWESGASGWDENTRRSFANDLDYPLSLIAVTASSNRSKSDRDPAGWLPPLKSYRCQYIGTWVAVKYRWSLTIDVAEKKVLVSTLGTCGKQSNVPIPKKAAIRLGAAPSASSSPVSTAPAGTHPRFASCAEAKRNGYNGPYTKGKHPEYEWYQDRDGDGVVCE